MQLRSLLIVLACMCRLPVMADFTMPLDSGWTFAKATVNAPEYPATVPGTVHTDLLANGLIPDPFYGTNESKVQWIENEEWNYGLEFACTRSMRKEKHIELQFEGIDTYADVYLNGELLFTAEDMFLSYSVDVKKRLKAHNTLLVHFYPAQRLIEKNKALSEIKNYPGGDRVFIRKAQYQFGWDWGPRMVTCGLWKPVRIVGWSGMHISDVVYKTDFLTKDTAYITADFTFEADKAGAYQFLVFQNDTSIYSDFYKVARNKPEHLKITFKVPHPKLWWCNGLGEPNLYRFALATYRGRKAAAVATITGIRKIEMSSDLHHDGSFTFILNDVPVFAQGTNWIPSDNFLPRVQQSKLQSQLRDMRTLNMNMVRVWGGGIYESDAFYSQCDSLGLMVWQDLPFACSMYPYAVLDKGNQLMREVIDNQRRIASHPSISIWCGDNENKEGWYNWGWQKQFAYSPADSAAIYNDYMNYNIKFMGCIAQHDPFFPYIASSPQNGWGRAVAYEQGDVHYWGVWWGMEPFSTYESHTGRFVSEFGFQGAPSLHTFKEMGTDVSKWFADSTIMQHQKHPTGYQTIETYMKRDYGITPNSFEDYVYLSQILQRDAMRTAIESQRRNMPRCMGSLFWQYNDCWPVTSWSVEDYYGRKKLAWHELKRLYQPELFSFEETADSVFVWLVTTNSPERAVNFSVLWQSFNGKKLLSRGGMMNSRGAQSSICCSFSKKELSARLSLDSGFLYAELTPGEPENPHRMIASATKTFGKPIDLALPQQKIKHSFVRYIREGPMAITVSAETFQKDVTVVCDDPDATFSQTCFDLLPGQSITIQISTKKTEAGIKESLHFISMNKLVNEERKEKQSELPD